MRIYFKTIVLCALLFCIGCSKLPWKGDDEVKQSSANQSSNISDKDYGRDDVQVDQLYGLSRRISNHQRMLWQLAEKHGVSRESFLENHLGEELNSDWLSKVANLKDTGWSDFVKEERDNINSIRNIFQEVSEVTHLAPTEFRRIVFV